MFRGTGLVCSILTRIEDFVIKMFQNHVEPCTQEGAQARADPIHPVVFVGESSYDGRSKCACGVRSASREVNGPDLGDEEGKTDPDRRKRGCAVFFNSEHVNRENEIRRDEHLEEHALDRADALG